MKFYNYLACVLIVGMHFIPAYADITDFSIDGSATIYDVSESLNPSPVKASNGDLVCCFAETGDGAAGGRCRFVRSTDNGATWSDPYIIMTSRHGEVGSINGYISKDPNGDIVLAATDVNATGPEIWRYSSDIKIYISTDNGLSFPSEPLAVVPTYAINGNWPSNPVRFLSNGDWILPGYYRDIAHGGSDFPCGFWRSSDSGKTWTEHELSFPIDSRAFNETDIIERGDGSLLAVARTDTINNGELFYTVSSDWGDTWSTPQDTGISGHCPSLIRWPGGGIMMGCRYLSTANWTSVYLNENESNVNFQFAFDATETRDNRNSATGYPIFTNIDNTHIFMGFYAGDTTLSWPDKTYTCGNMLQRTSMPLDYTYSYDADELPSADSPAYTYAGATVKTPENEAASVSGGVLTIDTDTDGADSDAAIYTLLGGTGTSWNPASGGPFTIEVRMKSFANNSSTYNAFLEWFDGNSDIFLQVWNNKCSLNGTEVTGLENSSVFHTYRIVSETYNNPSDQKFDLYRDGVLIINDATNYIDYTSPRFRFGDLTGSGEVNIAIDYICWHDDSNSITGYNYSYDANELPSAALPAYTYYSTPINATEAESTSISSGVLTIDTDTDGADSDAAMYTLLGGTGTSWNPASGGPFTIEVRMKSFANNSGTYNAFLEWFDGTSDIFLQVWNNKCSLNGTEVTGLENSSAFHTYRIVSETYSIPSNQKFDLYRDGVLIINDATNYIDYTSPQFRFGDLTGAGEVNVSIDYIQWNDQLAIVPNPTIPPGHASNPRPANAALGESTTPTLSWMAGSDVNSHDVYFGTNQTSVANATHMSSEFEGNQSSIEYNPGTLDANTTYYWRIDEIGDGGTRKGNTWSFTSMPPDYTYSYDADELPSASSPAYTYAGATVKTTESSAASVSSGVLTMDTETDGADSDGCQYTLLGGTGTSWNPASGGPFSMEVKMKSFANNSGTYNAFLEWFDGNSEILLQVWNNKCSLNGTEVTGLDNSSVFHTYRIVSETYSVPSNQKFDLYRDGVLIIDDAYNFTDYTTPRFRFGDLTGAGEVNVSIDYILWHDDSSSITGYNYFYDANELPSAALPAYTYYSTPINATQDEAVFASSGVLTIDTETDGVDSDAAYYTLTGGTGTDWNPSAVGPFTTEVRMKSFANNSGAYNAWFEWFDGNSEILLQVWNNQCSLNGTIVKGLDNSAAFHTYRIVSETYSIPSNQKFDLYRDGVLIIDDANNFTDYTTPRFRFGDMTGTGEVKVSIDYIRWNDQL